MAAEAKNAEQDTQPNRMPERQSTRQQVVSDRSIEDVRNHPSPYEGDEET